LIYLLSLGSGLLADKGLSLPGLGLAEVVRWPLAGALGISALAVGGSALVRFKRAGTRPEPWEASSALVEEGVYTFTRNPMYLGMAGLQLAAGVALNSIGALGTTLVSILIVDRLVIAREERYLRQRFGDPYIAYMRRVRRWL
jgi:protein-S-isoprenylcysteine O-methyltransferase Ste14